MKTLTPRKVANLLEILQQTERNDKIIESEEEMDIPVPAVSGEGGSEVVVESVVYGRVAMQGWVVGGG